MSIGYIFTKCRDGKYYRDLVYQDRERTWFICFDEDEPVELVMRVTCQHRPQDILAGIGLNCSKVTENGRSHRQFGNKLRPAISYFLTVDNGAPFPKPRAGVDHWDALYPHRPGLEGVYFGCRWDK